MATCDCGPDEGCSECGRSPQARAEPGPRTALLVEAGPGVYIQSVEASVGRPTRVVVVLDRSAGHRVRISAEALAADGGLA